MSNKNVIITEKIFQCFHLETILFLKSVTLDTLRLEHFNTTQRIEHFSNLSKNRNKQF